MEQMEKWYYRYFEKVLHQPLSRYSEDPEKILEPYHIRLDHEGESQDNLLKTWYISHQYPELTLFVQLNPGFCCAGNVTEAMSTRIQEETGIPVLSLTYDGTGGFKNDAILPYLKYSAAGAGVTGGRFGSQGIKNRSITLRLCIIFGFLLVQGQTVLFVGVVRIPGVADPGIFKVVSHKVVLDVGGDFVFLVFVLVVDDQYGYLRRLMLHKLVQAETDCCSCIVHFIHQKDLLSLDLFFGIVEPLCDYGVIHQVVIQVIVGNSKL